jgi:hypothetical protein
MTTHCALCLLFVIAEVLRPVKAKAIIAYCSAECLEPSRDPAIFKILYSGFKESI